jgi:CelD/BcsL family acetyltransferase involved in cellulose biosynthesis
MRDLGTPVYSARLFSETLRAFPGRARLYIVRHQGRPVAGSLTIRFRDTVVVPWASSLRAVRHLCPNMLLYWSMLEQSIEGGAKAFDFGRSSRGAGTHHFKQQWGATEIEQHWEYVLLNRPQPPDHGTSNAKFEAAIAAWQRLPVWFTKILGPPLVANIP